MRDTTYFIVGTNHLRFDKIKWYKLPFTENRWHTIGNSGDFWFSVSPEDYSKNFDLKKWMSDPTYQYKAHPTKSYKKYINELISYNI